LNGLKGINWNDGFLGFVVSLVVLYITVKVIRVAWSG